MLSRLVFLITFLIVFLAASSVFAEKLSLTAAIQISQKNNPDLTSAKNRWEAATAKIPQTLSLDDPKIGLEYEQIPSGSRSLDDGMRRYLAEQMVAFPGKIIADHYLAEKETDYYRAQYVAKKLEVGSQVKSAYYELYLSDYSIKVMREVSQLLANIFNVVQSQYAAGKVSLSDVLQANIESQLVENDLITMQQERDVKESKLKTLLGNPNRVTIETEATLAFPASLEALDRLEKLALKFRPELMAMKAEFDMQDAKQLRAKMDFFPDATLGVKKRVEDGWDAMFLFSVPLYFWKQGYGLSAAGLEREAAAADYTNMQNMTIWMLKEAWVMADAARRTAKLYEEKIVPQSTQSIKVTTAAYKVGRVDFQTLLQVERAYKEAKLELCKNQINFGKALAELEKVVGKELP